MGRHPARKIVVVATLTFAAIIAPLSVSAGATPGRLKPGASAALELLATHAGARAQPTAAGRAIVDLEVFDGRVYAGYGDYDANTGPIAITGMDGATGAAVDTFVSDTEAAYNLRVIGGKLRVPSTDPRTAADYAESGPWHDAMPVRATHVFDMATFDGTDLWMVGSQGNDAVAWRSLDGGFTWSESLRVTGGNGGFARFYFLASFDGRLWVQPWQSAASMSETSLSFDGAAWAASPGIVGRNGFGWHPEQFGGRLVFHSTGHGWAGSVHAFDGARTTTLARGYDFDVADGALYVLDDRGNVKKTTDLKNWQTIAKAPSTARSITVGDGRLYVGTTASEVLSAAL